MLNASILPKNEMNKDINGETYSASYEGKQYTIDKSRHEQSTKDE